jgi:hypothetical protein
VLGAPRRTPWSQGGGATPSMRVGGPRPRQTHRGIGPRCGVLSLPRSNETSST